MSGARHTILSLALVLALAAPALAADGGPLDFTATALDGSAVDGRELAGKAVLLDFWGTWCAPCVHAFPILKRLHADFGDRLTVVGMAYYSGALEEIAAFAAEHGLEYTIVEGHEETLAAFQIFAFPSYVLLSADGEVIFSQAGALDDLYARVAAALAAGAGTPSR